MIEKFIEWSGLEPTPEVIGGLARDWTMHPHIVGGEVRAIAAVSGSEIHFAISPAWRHRVIARHRAREFLAPLFNKYGFLTTRAEPSDNHIAFLSRLGFQRTYFDGKVDHFMLCALPFEKQAVLLGAKPSA